MREKFGKELNPAGLEQFQSRSFGDIPSVFKDLAEYIRSQGHQRRALGGFATRQTRIQQLSVFINRQMHG